MLLPPIRINTNLREAPAHKLTIFEHAARSTGAEDYEQLARWLDEKHLPHQAVSETEEYRGEPRSGESDSPRTPFPKDF